MAATMKVDVFRHMARVYWYIRTNIQEEIAANFVRVKSLTTVRTEAARAFEALVPIYQTTRRHIKKDAASLFIMAACMLVHRTLIIVFSNVPLHELSM